MSSFIGRAAMEHLFLLLDRGDPGGLAASLANEPKRAVD